MDKERATEVCETLKRYEMWRHGADCRRYTDIGIAPDEIRHALEDVIGYLAEEFGINDLPDWNCTRCKYMGRYLCTLEIIGRCGHCREKKQ